MAIYADDLTPGQEFRFSEYTLSEAEIIDYARQWDPIFIHTDPAAATAAGLDGVVASGLHMLGIYQRFVVDALWSKMAGGVGRSMELRFRRPVPPNTTLTGRAAIRSIEPRHSRGNAVVVIDGELTSTDGEVVLAIVNDSVLPLRAGSPR